MSRIMRGRDATPMSSRTGSQINRGGLRLLLAEELIQLILQCCQLSFKMFSHLYEPVLTLGLRSLPTPVRAVVVCESMTPWYGNPKTSRATRVFLVSQGCREYILLPVYMEGALGSLGRQFTLQEVIMLL